MNAIMTNERLAPPRTLTWKSLGLILTLLAPHVWADESAELGKVAPEVLDMEQRSEAAGMIEQDIRRRTTEANARNREEWSRIKTREEWEKYRDERIGHL